MPSAAAVVATIAGLSLTAAAVLVGVSLGTAVQVVDGDTLDVGGTRVRMVGIDAPEMSTPCGPVAKRALEDLVAAGRVSIERTGTTDKYGRTLAYVDAAGADAGAALLDAGLAVARYDSTDGYDWHPRQDDYHQRQNPRDDCGLADQQPAARSETGEAIDVDSIRRRLSERIARVWAEHERAVAEAERKAAERAERKAAERAERKAAERAERKATERAEREAAERAERKAAERAEREAAEEDGDGSGGGTDLSGYTGPRCYAPGGKSWKPCP